MRAIVFRQYGAPNSVMHLESDRETPEPSANEVLVKVERCSVNAADLHMVRANYLIVRMFVGLLRPARKNQVLGMDMTGRVHALGDRVRGFEVGDRVAADIRTSMGGGFAEYALADAKDLVKVPDAVTFEQAATVPISGQAAMMGITLCEIKAGDRLLVRGASGGVGSFAVKLAKALGAHVTAMCATSKIETVMAWGPDEVFDYNTTPLQALGSDRFDAVFDAACFGSPGVFSEALKEDGVYVLVGGNYYNRLRVKFFGGRYARHNQRFKVMSQDVAVRDNIATVLGMISRTEIDPYIQKVVPLSGVPEAISSVERREVIGKIVVNTSMG